MSEPAQHEEELFAAALVLPIAERRQYLVQTCGDDGALFARIEALLSAHDDAGNLLEDAPGSAVRAALSASPFEEKVGAMIGRYKLLQKIGEGGWGVVFMFVRSDAG